VLELTVALADLDGVAAEPFPSEIFSDPPAEIVRTSVSSSVNSNLPL
jgi:hypothetical protein